MDGSRFRRPKNADEDAAWLRETTPQNTRNSTKWSLKIFKEWQGARSNEVAANESLGFEYGKVDEVQDLTVDIMQMSPVFKLLDDEVRWRNWKSFRWSVPSKITVSNRLWVTSVNVCNVNGEDGVNMLAKGDRR